MGMLEAEKAYLKIFFYKFQANQYWLDGYYVLQIYFTQSKVVSSQF